MKVQNSEEQTNIRKKQISVNRAKHEIAICCKKYNLKNKIVILLLYLPQFKWFKINFRVSISKRILDTNT